MNRYVSRFVSAVLFALISPILSAQTSILFFGDMMLERRLEPVIAERGAEYLFDGVRNLPDGRSLESFDLVGANLEGAVTEGGRHAEPVYPYDFAFRPERVAVVREIGITYVTIANNHLWDQGRAGVDSTRSYLSQTDIRHSGEVDSVVSEHSITMIDVDGLRVAMVALSEVYGTLDSDAVDRLVRRGNDDADLVIVNIHWGKEYKHIANTRQRERARRLVESGADVIIGHHPHVTQGMELIGGAPVFYSLGNFIFDQAFSDAVREGLAVELVITDGAYSIALWPFRSIEFQPRWRSGDDRARALTDIASWSFVSDEVAAAIEDGEFMIAR